jgi:hypothetical protein
MSCGSAVDIASDNVLDDREVGIRVSIGSRIFVSLYSPDRLWGQPTFLFPEHLGSLSSGAERHGR